jgi:hypothetical protein
MRAARYFLLILVIPVLLLPRVVRAEPTREFIMSATYGVLAGTLVGAATLAFTDKPGDNLRNIARGASYGLYAGMLLGLYVVYGLPGEDEDESRPVDQPAEDENYNPDDRSEDPEEPRGPSGSIKRPALIPLISDRGVEGAGVLFRMTF